jgi:hypothetical protein
MSVVDSLLSIFSKAPSKRTYDEDIFFIDKVPPE